MNFHDATLRERVERRAANTEDVAAGSDVGARKLAAYGAACLETIAAHRAAAGRAGGEPGPTAPPGVERKR